MLYPEKTIVTNIYRDEAKEQALIALLKERGNPSTSTSLASLTGENRGAPVEVITISITLQGSFGWCDKVSNASRVPSLTLAYYEAMLYGIHNTVCILFDL